MSLGTYLTPLQQRLLSYGLTAAGLALSVYGVNDARTPHFPVNPDALNQVYTAGRQWGPVSIKEDLSARMKGLGAFALGAVMLGGGVAIASSDKGITPPEMPEPQALPPGADIPLSAFLKMSPTEARGKIIHRLMEILERERWLLQLLKCRCIILVGDQGAGKSTVANAIAVLRSLLFEHEIYVLDPHADLNLDKDKQVWTQGKVFGSRKLGDNLEPVEQILRASEYALSPREKGEPDLTAICDEISSWGTLDERMKEFAGAIAKASTQDARKYRNYYILCPHGITKDMLGDLGDGRIESLLTQAAIVHLHATVDDYGEPGFSGRLSLKPSNTPNVKANYSKHVLPGFFKPGQIQKFLQPIFEYIGLTLDQDPLGRSLISPEIEDLVSRGFNVRRPEVIQRLNDIYRGPTAPGTDTDENRVNGIDWERVANPERAIAFLRYVFDKGSKYLTDRGHLEVRKVYQSWARHQGLSVEDFRDFLTGINHAGLGSYADSEGKGWFPTVSPDSLPSEDS